MEFVEDYVIRRICLYSLFIRKHELGICEERDVREFHAAGSFQVFQLRAEYVFARRQPQDTGRRVILREFECDEGFARSGRMDDGGFAARGEHGANFIVCSPVVIE